MIPNPDTRSLQPSAGILDGTTWACRPALGEQETAPPTTATRPLEIRAASESPLMARRGMVGQKGGCMAHPKTTSKPVATKASKALSNPKSSKATKSIAGSALSQKHGTKKK